MHRALMALSISIVLYAAGCTPVATFPSVEGAVDVGKPAFAPIPTLMADSIRFAHERYNEGADEVVVNLPPQTPGSVYRTVIEKIGTGRPMREDDERAYHVQQVRVRGLDASVDLIFPRVEGEHELVTISLRKDLFGGWSVSDTRLWRIHVEVPGTNYVAPPSDGTAPKAMQVATEPAHPDDAP